MEQPDAAYDWSERFDDAAAEQLASSPATSCASPTIPIMPPPVPTPDHFIPMLYIAGMAAEQGEPLDALVRGYAMGSISMTCYGLGAGDLGCSEEAGAAILPAGVPPEQTNI